MHFKSTRVRFLFPSVYSINESPVKVFIVMNINTGLSKDPRDPILYVIFGYYIYTFTYIHISILHRNGNGNQVYLFFSKTELLILTKTRR